MASVNGLTLPDFIGIGPARTGTTWLHQMLAARVCLPYRVKETGFFNRNYSNGIAWYAQHFRRCSAARPIAEICPYFAAPNAPQRIAHDLPGAKIICTLRDPVERAHSYWRLMRRYAWTRLDFEQALDHHRQPLDASRYAHHLARWFSQFDRERVHVACYEDLRSDPQRFLDAITKFISIDRIELSGVVVNEEGRNAAERAPRSRKLAQNARHVLFWLESRRAIAIIDLFERAGLWRFCFEGGEPFAPLPAEVDARVRARFVPEIEALEKLIGRDLSDWKVTGARTVPSEAPSDRTY
ncbi:MAG: sulfotransferase domain-containing protein [Candidatus Binataceae bacterium]